MSEIRYTGPNAKDVKEQRRTDAISYLESRDPVEIVNEIVRNLGLDDRYIIRDNGKVSDEYKSIPAEERLRASEAIQREIQDDYLRSSKPDEPRRTINQTQKNDRTKKVKPKRKIRYDRIAAVGMAATLLTSLGYAVHKHVFLGKQNEVLIETGGKVDSSMSDPIIEGDVPNRSQSTKYGRITLYRF